MPEAKKNVLDQGKPLTDTSKVVESNHNTVADAKPVGVATITDPKYAKPDYNPMRRPGGYANVQSDTSMSRDDNENVVGEKGDRQSAAANERDRLNSIPEDEMSQAQISAKAAVNEQHPADEAAKPDPEKAD